MKAYAKNRLFLFAAAVLLAWAGNAHAVTVRTVGYNEATKAVLDRSEYSEVIDAEDLVRQRSFTGSVIVAPSPYQYMVWMYNTGSKIYGSFKTETNVIAIQFAFSDSNDGIAKIFIDGTLVASLDSYSQGNWYVELSDLSLGLHSFTIEAASNTAGHDDLHIDAIAGKVGCMQPPADLIGWWPADGNAYDIAKGRRGALLDGADYAAGTVNQAFALDGSSGYVRVADQDSLDTPEGFTVDAWINPSSFEGARVIASKWDDPTGQWSWIFKLHNDGSGRLRIEISRGDHDALGDVSGTAVLPLNTWSHVAASYDRQTSKIRLYLNGSIDSEGSAQFPGVAVNNSATDLLIGAVNGQTGAPGEFFEGRIDEVELFSRALSVDEIRSIYLAGSAGKCRPQNMPPVANAGPDQTVEQSSCTGALVTLDGSASFDPDDDAITYSWSWSGGTAAGVNPAVELPYGTTTATLTVDDGKGATSTDEVVIQVVDTTAPVLNLSVGPNLLWPPNHKYVKVTPSVSVTDVCMDTVQVLRVSVTSSEPDNGLGDGDTAHDIIINGDDSVSLRAERSGAGSGRVYTITYEATDMGGNRTTGIETVTVPHNR